MSIVRVEHVSKDYQMGNQLVRALHDISLVIAPGRFLAIAGPSGSGKTTLLNLIGCILAPSSGALELDGERVFDGHRWLRPDLRRAKPLPRYGFYSCGVPGQSQDATHLTVGLSIGWGDMYPWNYAGQRIDVSSVPDGDYLLCLSADPLRQFTERREGNNEGWAKLRLTSHPDPTFHVSVDILARGTPPCAKQVPYPIPDPSIAARHA